jgi:AcrR family transcriptional regulator
MAVATAPSTRQRLVAAAIAVFRREGYERARVQDIAREAGLTTGAIYANYRGKAELLAEAIGAHTAHELEALLRDLKGRSALDALTQLGDRLILRDGERPLLLEAVVASARDPEVAQMVRERVRDRETRFAALIARAQRDGEIDPAIDGEAMTRFCVTLAFGAVAMRTLDQPALDPDAWRVLITRFLGALAPTTEGSRQ